MTRVFLHPSVAMDEPHVEQRGVEKMRWAAESALDVIVRGTSDVLASAASAQGLAHVVAALGENFSALNTVAALWHLSRRCPRGLLGLAHHPACEYSAVRNGMREMGERACWMRVNEVKIITPSQQVEPAQRVYLCVGLSPGAVCAALRGPVCGGGRAGPQRIARASRAGGC